MPGELGIWAFIITDLTVFSLYFVTFFAERHNNPAIFAHGNAVLQPGSGAFNAGVLLTSSLFVAMAVQAVVNGQGGRARRYLVIAIVFGLAFSVNKSLEWMRLLNEGYGPHHDPFFQLYFMLTGLHLVHVAIGLTVLVYQCRMAGHVIGQPTPRQSRYVENGASYWHLVDVIWLVLFAIFYLVR